MLRLFWTSRTLVTLQMSSMSSKPMTLVHACPVRPTYFQSFYFDRDDVALPNIAKWLKKQSDEEREHAEMFMKQQNRRGGRIVLQNVQKPEKDDWGSALEAFQAALALEKFNNQSLLDLHGISSQNGDSQVYRILT